MSTSTGMPAVAVIRLAPPTGKGVFINYCTAAESSRVDLEGKKTRINTPDNSPATGRFCRTVQRTSCSL